MNYYWFNRKKSCKKQKKIILKKKVLSIINKTKELQKKRQNLSQEQKDKIKEYQKIIYQELVQYKKEALKK